MPVSDQKIEELAEKYAQRVYLLSPGAQMGLILGLIQGVIGGDSATDDLMEIACERLISEAENAEREED